MPVNEPHVCEPHIIETHISRVLLHGAWAYKVKKPVKLPFLDFSTPALRRHFCAEELRINARTAPKLYVDVRPLSVAWEQFVRQPEAALAASREDDALDWVLRMRRFEPDALLSTRCAQGLLQAEQVDRLAEHVAQFHSGLAPMPASWRPSKTVPDWVADSLQAVLHHPQRLAQVSAADVLEAGRRLCGQLAALAPWMEARQQAGWVRECHGDLHLGNLIDWQGQVMAFDAIEFDAELRCIDVMNDLAFAFMDLLAHGQPALAWRLVSGWLEITGDADGLKGLRAYAAYRSLVRARVALLGSGAQAGFERYWGCLQGLLDEPATPCLWLMMGLSGSGKSTVAALLRDALAARGTPVVRLRSDVERKRCLGVAATDRPGPQQVVEWYGAETTRYTFARLQSMASQVLAAGCCVIVDAASLRVSDRDSMRAVAAAAGAGFRLVACSAPDDALRQRLAERERQGLDPSDAGVSVMERQRHFVEPLTDEEQALTSRVRNDADLPALQAQVESLLVRSLDR